MGQDPAFDVERIRTLLHPLIAGRGQAQWFQRGSRNFVILTPADEGSATMMTLTLVEDEAVICTGLGSLIFQSTGGDDAEEDLIAVIEAILAGGAEELIQFDDDGFLRTGVVVKSPEFTLGQPKKGSLSVRRLPPWSPA